MRCPSCRRKLDQDLVAAVETEGGEDPTFQCPCGAVLTQGDIAEARRKADEPVVSVVSTAELSRRIQDSRARKGQRELGKLAERVCFLICSTDIPEIDVLIEREKVRARCEELFPDRMELYEMIYERRFERLWSQFR